MPPRTTASRTCAPINEAIRYAPVSARYKVYILDEVHMLSGAAFNALLKTLEEPPPHAKFVFATTEIRKVPITVLSRCQRFDLRRVDAALLVKHLQGIAEKEAITAEPEALALIARAAEGSVRDALSLLDQAIAHAGAEAGAGKAKVIAGPVRAEDVRQMLGLADRTKIIDLFEALMRADLARALREVRDQYDTGADPAMVLGDLAEFTHFVTRVKDRAGLGRRCLAHRNRTHARPRLCRQALDARSGAHLADAAQGHRGGRGGRTAARRRRDGAGAHRLRRRPADAGRSDPLARRRNARQWRGRWRDGAGRPVIAAAGLRAEAPRADVPRGATRAALAAAAPAEMRRATGRARR